MALEVGEPVAAGPSRGRVAASGARPDVGRTTRPADRRRSRSVDPARARRRARAVGIRGALGDPGGPTRLARRGSPRRRAARMPPRRRRATGRAAPRARASTALTVSAASSTVPDTPWRSSCSSCRWSGAGSARRSSTMSSVELVLGRGIADQSSNGPVIVFRAQTGPPGSVLNRTSSGDRSCSMMRPSALAPALRRRSSWTLSSSSSSPSPPSPSSTSSPSPSAPTRATSATSRRSASRPTSMAPHGATMDLLSIATRVPDHIAELHREAATARLSKPAGRS